MKNWIIAALVAVIAVGASVGAFAGTRTVDRVIEVRVWENIEDPSENHISIRVQGGSWRPGDTRYVPMSKDDGRYRYGDLSIVLPVPVSVGPDVPLGTAESSGHWSITRYYDTIYDRETVVATLSPEAAISREWTGAEHDLSYAQVYCSPDGLHALIYWDKSVFGPLTPSPFATLRSVKTVWRIDGEPPVEERWLTATFSQATFAQYPSEFVSAILGKSTLIMRITPSNVEDHTLTLDVSGLADVMGNLPCYPR